MTKVDDVREVLKSAIVFEAGFLNVALRTGRIAFARYQRAATNALLDVYEEVFCVEIGRFDGSDEEEIPYAEFGILDESWDYLCADGDADRESRVFKAVRDIVGLLGVIEDLSVHYRANEIINKARRKLNVLGAVESEFTATMMNDLELNYKEEGNV